MLRCLDCGRVLKGQSKRCWKCYVKSDVRKKQTELFSENRKLWKGNKHPNWRGGKRIVGGYVYIYCPDHPHVTKQGYVCEHRLVVEKKLGRYLKNGEAVHHINGRRTDNRIENLVVCCSNGKHYYEHHLRGRNEFGQFV